MSTQQPIRLGVNIDHVATLRNARGGVHPDPLRVAQLLADTGHTDLITVHLREDRRHIRDADVYAIREKVGLPLNLEMAVTAEMLKIAQDVKPDWACLVPEKRQEITTEGGLAIAPIAVELKEFIKALQGTGIKVSLFVDPDETTIHQAADAGADAVELHTGTYAHGVGETELARLINAAALCETLGLQCHAGHGLTFENVSAVAAIPQIQELNIGHYLIGEAMWLGLPGAVSEMKRLMLSARA